MGKYTEEADEYLEKAIRLAIVDRNTALIGRLIVCLIRAVEEHGIVSEDELRKHIEGMS